jgi:hypothetical protein
MVKCPGNCAGRMAFVAWDAGIGISSNAIVLAVHISLVMVMAIDTCEGFITARCIMTGGTTAPGTCVFPGIYREVLCIMDLEARRFPARQG